MEKQIIENNKVYAHGVGMLESMFKLQSRFHLRMNPQFKNITEVGREQLLINTSRNIIMEAAELMEWCNWKNWRRTRKEVDWEQVKYEIADILAFTMNAAIEAGMTEEDLYQYYMRKGEVNVKRQEEGY